MEHNHDARQRESLESNADRIRSHLMTHHGMKPEDAEILDHSRLIGAHDLHHYAWGQDHREQNHGLGLEDPEVRFDLARHFVDQCGYEVNDTNVEQMMVYLEAFYIFHERNREWRDLWAEYGWMDSLQHIRSKSARLMRALWGKDDGDEKVGAAMDSVVDLINYCVFFIRNFRAKNKWGRTNG